MHTLVYVVPACRSTYVCVGRCTCTSVPLHMACGEQACTWRSQGSVSYLLGQLAVMEGGHC